jgi:hypothetical protein
MNHATASMKPASSVKPGVHGVDELPAGSGDQAKEHRYPHWLWTTRLLPRHALARPVGRHQCPAKLVEASHIRQDAARWRSLTSDISLVGSNRALSAGKTLWPKMPFAMETGPDYCA